MLNDKSTCRTEQLTKRNPDHHFGFINIIANILSRDEYNLMKKGQIRSRIFFCLL